MQKTILQIIIISLLLFGVSSQINALSDDKTQPLHIRADYAELVQKERKTHYRGNVIFDQGSSHLRAARADTVHNEQNELLSAVAIGNEESPAYFWTLLEAGKPEMHAKADTIKFFPKEHKILLIGNAEVTQGRDRFTAPYIEYDINKRHVVSKSSTQGSGRTTILFHRKDRAK